MPKKQSRLSIGLALAVPATILACNTLLGLNDLSIEQTGPADAAIDGFVGECTTHRECIDQASSDPGDGSVISDAGVVAAMCVKPEQKCVELLTQDCTTVIGDYTDDDAILIGSMFGLTGAQTATNQARQRAAVLALEQINRNGIPVAGTSAETRQLVMLSCNADLNVLRAARHLVNDLHVPAIVGPNTSQDTLDVSKNVSIAGGTVVITPSALASEITGLSDKDLTWLMIPSDVQRAPLTINQINTLESEIRGSDTARNIKLAIIYRNDALGLGTNTSLTTLTLNGKSLVANTSGSPPTAKIRAYNPDPAGTYPDLPAIVTELRDFAPDVVVLAGTAEVVTKVMIPLEVQWTSPSSPPHYVLIDSAKVTNLLAAVTSNADTTKNLVPAPESLRKRVRGTGTTPGTGTPSRNVFTTFQLAYTGRYTDRPASETEASGVGPSYDATYVIAYALAATNDLPISGANLAKGLRKLSGGATTVLTGSTTLLTAFQKLVARENINAIGTFGPLSWDQNGAPNASRLEVWCITTPESAPKFQPSGLEYDLKNGDLVGTFNAPNVCGY